MHTNNCDNNAMQAGQGRSSSSTAKPAAITAAAATVAATDPVLLQHDCLVATPQQAARRTGSLQPAPRPQVAESAMHTMHGTACTRMPWSARQQAGSLLVTCVASRDPTERCTTTALVLLLCSWAMSLVLCGQDQVPQQMLPLLSPPAVAVFRVPQHSLGRR